MYEYLEGRLVQREPARIVLDVGGVGYTLLVPLYAEFPEESGSDGRLRVFTHFVVREDLHQLYGFPDARSREIFRLLLSVRGVGPGLALAILSSLTPERLIEAVAAEDLASLVSIRGVGRKTAEQVLLDLRDKARAWSADDKIPATPPSAGGGGGQRLREDAVRALTSIGYSDREARRSVERASKAVDPENLELLVRAALQE